MTWDILIRGGMVIDGSGRPARLSTSRSRVGGSRASPRRSRRGGAVIDAAGLAVTPGFIDIKTHSDFTLPITRRPRARCARG